MEREAQKESKRSKENSEKKEFEVAKGITTSAIPAELPVNNLPNSAPTMFDGHFGTAPSIYSSSFQDPAESMITGRRQSMGERRRYLNFKVDSSITVE